MIDTDQTDLKKVYSNTLDHKVKAYIDAENGIDSEQKAFPILMVAALLDVSDEEAEDSITDGSKDRGVDAIYVDDRDGANSIHVFQFKYVSSFENTKKNFPSGEIDKLVSFFVHCPECSIRIHQP